ncbi:hypothetical protein [Halorussus caseinilyticus]|uniref:DUF460 domain-containing protein n=1 Tax=Halorussus caseinilyticus TaxID=3034025 RepID=A0ABD5WRE7_9EURY|nr:hypothetical protein [Halorussus sp. DT72]
MRVRVGEATRTGRAIDLRGVDFEGVGVDASAVADAIRAGPGESSAVVIDCPDPGPAHAHVGVIRAEMDVSLRVALAAAARSRGHTAPQAEELAAVRDRLDALDVPEIDLRRARRRVAEASDVADELRERVATLQGRVQALRGTPAGEDLDAAESDLEDATRRLSEVETERIAAEQALSRARDRARANRARRRERLRLADRESNLRRRVRETLADEVREAFEGARSRAPSNAVRESVRTALAVARVAELDAPVVLVSGVDCFESAEAAARWLDTPVISV